MRERTPSADDTPARAPPTPSTPPTPPNPPTPSTETASAKVVVDTGLLVTLSVAPVASVLNNSSKNNKIMVASSHSLEEMGVTHPASASGDRGVPDNNRTAQTALDKRSRLSNVINNLRKKVPDAQPQQQQQEQQLQQRNDNDGRNSVERNLENLEKYVMTVLNGVIKDEAEKVEENRADEEIDSRKNQASSGAVETEAQAPKNEEASYPYPGEDKTEEEEWRRVKTGIEVSDEGAQGADKNADEALEGAKNVVQELTSTGATVAALVVQGCKKSGETSANDFSGGSNGSEKTEESTVDFSVAGLIAEKNPRRLSAEKWKNSESDSEENPTKLMDICRELMSDLLSNINSLMIEGRTRDTENQDSRLSVSSPNTSFHCSLPLEKVAPMLKSCHQKNQTTNSPVSSSSASMSPQRSPSRPSPPTVKHLCLYCDRKFLSISLRQRHSERVHQVGGGGSRRSERNSRKTIQNCQYCSERVPDPVVEGSDSNDQTPSAELVDNLDGLFRHMARTHSDRYYACVQCTTRYANRESLANHTNEMHGSSSPSMSVQSSQDNGGRETPNERSMTQTGTLVREQLAEQGKSEKRFSEIHESGEKDALSNLGSPDFDSTFYSSVSCNIRENLLHHLDGKLQTNSPTIIVPAAEIKPQPIQPQQQQQNFYDSNATQIQFPIDISLTAATPVYSKEYSTDGTGENSSEYAQRPGKTRTHPRRVSFEKYNFPRKYDGKEPWSCSIKDLSKFDISTQLTLRKKQQLTKPSSAINRLSCQNDSSEQIIQSAASGQMEIIINVRRNSDDEKTALGDSHDALGTASVPTEDSSPNSPRCSDLNLSETDSNNTMFTTEFAKFMRLKRWDDDAQNVKNHREIVYAELTGEWSRPRIYICGACADRHITLKEMEEHKACAHPNVWCSHFEFAGDQRDLYKHLFIHGKGSPTAKARAAISPDKICTKCSRNCNTLAELHRHMLECGGDQTWLLGLFGNGKKKCKWRPFGSRSRRRRQRGMKRNIQNSQQTPRANTPKDRPASGPRVRPSDRESIQKMLANLPPKRASRKVLREENLARSREAAQTVQTRSRPRMSAEASSSAVQSRNKAVLKNKLLKNAKSFQRNRRRIDNITAAIESVVSRRMEAIVEGKAMESRKNEDSINRVAKIAAKNVIGVLSKKKNVKTKNSTITNIENPRTRARPLGSTRVSNRSRNNATNSTIITPSKIASSNGPGKNNPAGSKIQHPQQTGGKNSPVESEAREEEDNEEESEDNINEENRSQTPVEGVRTRKSKLIDPAASIKAKQQLRTNDGKFARSPNPRPAAKGAQISDRYPRRHVHTTQFVPKSRIKATREFSKDQICKSGKRGGRLSSDSDKMPTLEPAIPVKNLNQNNEKESDKPGRGKELPVLSPVAVTERRTSKGMEKDVGKTTLIEDHLDFDDVLEKSVIDVAALKNTFQKENALEQKKNGQHKRIRGTRGKRITLAVAPPTPVTSSASSSSSSSCSSSSLSPSLTRGKAKTRRNVPHKKSGTVENQDDKQGPTEVVKDDILTRFGLKVGEQKPTRRSTRTLSLPKEQEDETNSSVDELPGNLKSREKIINTSEDAFCRKVGRIRKSPRNLAAKNSTKKADTPKMIERDEDEDFVENRIGEKMSEESKADPNNDAKILLPNGDCDPEEQLEEDLGLLQRGRGLGKRRGRIKHKPKIDDDGIPDLETQEEDEETADFVSNANLEHLQLESSNSNVDSGKENSSETPITVPKPRAIRTRKTKSGRPGRERTAKRTLGSVIGILTEGVNIPVEVQQSVVLTVQTSVGPETVSSGNEFRPDEEHREEVAEENLEEKKPEDGSGREAVQTLESLPNAEPKPTNVPESGSIKPEGGAQIVEEPESLMSSIDSGIEKILQDVQDHEKPPKVSETFETPVSTALNITLSGKSSSEAALERKEPIEPSTDIIKDLSRRKPKGKGSFLEKIVSKIAKKKDVLLVEGDVGSLLDNAVDELTNILDEVAPNLAAESMTENLSTRNDRVISVIRVPEDEAKTALRTKEPDEKKDVILVLPKNDETLGKSVVVEKGPIIRENILRIPDISFLRTLREHRVQEPVELDPDIKANEDSMASKKRAFETNTPKKNKRKSVDADAVPEAEDLSTEELCLADIMKLIQKPKITAEKDSDSARPGKRKPDDERDRKIPDENFEVSDFGPCNTIENSLPEEGGSKRPKRRSTKNKSLLHEHLSLADDNSCPVPAGEEDDDFEDGSKPMKTSPKKINKRKTLPDDDRESHDTETDESLKINNTGNRSAKRRSVQMSDPTPEEPTPAELIKKPSSGGTFKASFSVNEILQEEPQRVLAQRRSSKRKSFVAGDNDTETSLEDRPSTLKTDEFNENSGSKAKNIKRLTDNSVFVPFDEKTNTTEPTQYLNASHNFELGDVKAETKKRKSITGGIEPEEQASGDCEVRTEALIEESKKIKTSRSATVEESTTTKKRVTKKISLVDEHLDLPSDELVAPSKLQSPILSSVEVRLDLSESGEGRSRSLRRRNSKRKSLAEDHLELFDEEEIKAQLETFKVPEISDVHHMRTRRSSKRFLTLTEPETQESNSELKSDTIDHSEIPTKRIGAGKSSTERSLGELFTSNPNGGLDRTESDTESTLKPISTAANPAEVHIPENKIGQITAEIIDTFEETSLLNEHMEPTGTDEGVFEKSPSPALTESMNSNNEQETTTDISVEDDQLQQQQTPKKRGSGNFAVGHTKTGEILIVEKKKKLTKEEARFFCEVCTTSFTRKSSLKKHNSSQSHLIQVAKAESSEKTSEIDDFSTLEGEEGDDNTKASEEREEDDQNLDYWGSDDSLEALEESVKKLPQRNTSTPKCESPVITAPLRAPKHSLTAQISEEEALEEELLDEEICKITENMTHDDFVLTDHISPDIPTTVTLTENNIEKREKSDSVRALKTIENLNDKKRNLAEEHLDLDSPSPPQICKIDANLEPSNLQGSSLETSPTFFEIEPPERKTAKFSKSTKNFVGQELLLTKAAAEAEEAPLVRIAEDTTESTSSSSARAFCLKSLTLVDDIAGANDVGSSRVVSIPVTIQRDVLVPEDESSSDRPLAEVLKKGTLPRSRNSRRCLTPDEKSGDIKILTNSEEVFTKRSSAETLDFLNITEKLSVPPVIQSEDENKRKPDADFDSDDSCLDKRISADIRKLLDDPEMSEDQKEIEKSGVPLKASLSYDDLEARKARRKTAGKKALRQNGGGRSWAKEHPRESKAIRDRRNQKVLKNLAGSEESGSSENEENDDEENSDIERTSKSTNKNKIVKSVFGRVFGGDKVEKSEKIQDKVKEVLDDWDSRSDDDSGVKYDQISSSPRTSPGSRARSSRSKKRRNRSKTKPRVSEERAKSIPCRRSKKRAEERISKAFEEESASTGKEIANRFLQEPDEDNEFPNVSDQRDSSKTNEIPKLGDDEWALFSGENVNRVIAAPKEIETKRFSSKAKQHEDSPFADTTLLPPWPSMLPSPSSSPSPSSPGQSSMARSSVRNRSPTPDRNSQSSGASDSENDDGPRGRLSPIYARNTPDTSIMDSGSEANSNDLQSAAYNIDSKKSVLPLVSPSLKIIENESQVVTIAPTDAAEDNALDVPRTENVPTANSVQKPRQAKVLNFDEELFVECCSRLKASSENELRGAKKIEIVHSDSYHKKDIGPDGSGHRTVRDRWRDVESQNSLGSLLESVNQLLGEEMYANNEKDGSYAKNHVARDPRSENSSRSGSPDIEASCRPPDNLGYEDSLDVAFEHNNKLRDKIQQRMRESENLLANSFGCEASTLLPNTARQYYGDDKSRGAAPPQTPTEIPTDHSRAIHVAKVAVVHQEHHPTGKNVTLDSGGFKHKMTSTLGGLLDKLALSNLLHSTTRLDNNGSTPMKVLAELACARAPTLTAGDLNPEVISAIQNEKKDFSSRKIRNPIKELFERKKEINERNQSEKSQAVVVAVAALKELNVQRQRRTTKKSKKRVIQEFPLVRKSPYSGMPEKKKRKELLFDKKLDDGSIRNDRVKDIYDFDDEESQAEATMTNVGPFRSKTLPGELPDVASITPKTIVDTLVNGKEADALGRRLESMIDRKFREAEKSTPKTKGALKAFQNDRGNTKEVSDTDNNGIDKRKDAPEVRRETTIGPMDDFVQKKHYSKRNGGESAKRTKLKKRSKTSRKKSRVPAWYENDSSDEFRTAAKAEDVGVGISKSQRTCSKGKQNLFAELSTSSESEAEDDMSLDYGSRQKISVKEDLEISRESLAEAEQIGAGETSSAEREDVKKTRNYSETKKSESEMSDHPLIIDERRESDEDSSVKNNYEPSFEMDDLYREDSSDEAEAECPGDEREKNENEVVNTDVISSGKFMKDDELIPLEEALDLLDSPEPVDGTTTKGLICKEKENGYLIAKEEKIKLSLVDDGPQDHSESPTDVNADVTTQDEEESVQLPEKLSGNEKPIIGSDNLPLHVFLSRKVQESKKRKQQHLKKLQEEQERILLELQPTRRQRKCAIGKQGLLAEISSSDEDLYDGGSSRRFHEKEKLNSSEKPQRKQKRESREKRKERYIEKKHEQIIAKEQKAIQEEILRELGKKKDERNIPLVGDEMDKSLEQQSEECDKTSSKKVRKQKPKKDNGTEGFDSSEKLLTSESENCKGERSFSHNRTVNESLSKQRKPSKSDQKSSKKSSGNTEIVKSSNRAKKHSGLNKPSSEWNGKEINKDVKESRKSSGMKRNSTDEELRTTKSWNKVEEGVGVAIGRRKRAAANQLYYWSSSSDEEEVVEEPAANVEEDDERQEQHGWIVGDSHKRMITMLAMEKQLKEKRRRSEDEFEPNKAKNKKHRNSTS